MWNFEKLAAKLFRFVMEFPKNAFSIRAAPGIIVNTEVAAKVLVTSSYA